MDKTAKAKISEPDEQGEGNQDREKLHLRCFLPQPACSRKPDSNSLFHLFIFKRSFWWCFVIEAEYLGRTWRLGQEYCLCENHHCQAGCWGTPRLRGPRREQYSSPWCWAPIEIHHRKWIKGALSPDLFFFSWEEFYLVVWILLYFVFFQVLGTS